jgi:hypothetical protein
MPATHLKFSTTDKVHHSMQWLAFPARQTRDISAGTGLVLGSAQNVLENKKLPVRIHHHFGDPSRKAIRQLDSQLRQRRAVPEQLNQAIPMTGQIIKMRQKSLQRRLTPETI